MLLSVDAITWEMFGSLFDSLWWTRADSLLMLLWFTALACGIFVAGI